MFYFIVLLTSHTLKLYSISDTIHNKISQHKFTQLYITYYIYIHVCISVKVFLKCGIQIFFYLFNTVF